MTTPQEQAEQFRADLRADLAEIMDELHSQRIELTNICTDIESIREGLANASQPAPAVGTSTMTIDIIIMSYDDKGAPTYKAKGQPYPEFGVRVWEEVLPLLGIDPLTLKPGPNTITPAIAARILMGEHTRKDGTVAPSPRKVTGKA